MKFLHLAKDEKFLKNCMEDFHSLSDSYLLMKGEFGGGGNKGKSCNIFEFVFFFFLFVFKYRPVIILHSAVPLFKILTILTPVRVKVVWIGFGFDYYHYRNIDVSNRGKIKKKIKYEERFISRVDYFCPVLKSEFSFVKDAYPNSNFKYLDFNYDVISDFLNENNSVSGNNILLGNSATKTNNHIDALDLMTGLNLDGRKIILPLSYGSQVYAKSIIDSYTSNLPNNCIFLNKFVPMVDYYKLISTCSHVIMLHDRQQALGNILISLYAGASVFLKTNNPIYNDLKEKGFVIFDMTDWGVKYNQYLNSVDVEKNRELMMKYFCRQSYYDKIKAFLHEIDTDEY